MHFSILGPALQGKPTFHQGWPWLDAHRVALAILHLVHQLANSLQCILNIGWVNARQPIKKGAYLPPLELWHAKLLTE